jgi:hypothetical protein
MAQARNARPPGPRPNLLRPAARLGAPFDPQTPGPMSDLLKFSIYGYLNRVRSSFWYWI